MEIKPLLRDENGLIKGVNYTLDAEGQIDWRKMVKPEYLVVNRQRFEREDKEIPTTIENLEDKDLLILLAGIKNLARLRGFSSVLYQVATPSSEYVIVTCHIQWISNFETEGRVIATGGTADAHPGNTNSFARSYLCAIAENRAFVRCVRNFLNIAIVGQDEVSAKTSPEEVNNVLPQTSPASALEKLMVEKKVTFDTLKARMIADGFAGAAEIMSIAEIPKLKMFELMDRLKKKV